MKMMNSSHSRNCNREYYSKVNQACCLDSMIERYGLYETAIFCKINAFKYKYRRGNKDGETYESDTEKMQWYMNMYNELITEFCEKVGK